MSGRAFERCHRRGQFHADTADGGEKRRILIQPARWYQIRATYYVDETLVYYTEENITVPKEGNFVLCYRRGTRCRSSTKTFSAKGRFRVQLSWRRRSVASLLRRCLLGRLGRREEKKGTKVEKVERVEMEGWRELPSDLRLVLSIIEKEGGRITLRRRRSA